MDTPEIQCPNCHKLINYQAMFCEYCGRKVIQIPDGTPINPPQKKRKFYTKTAWIIGGVLTLFYVFLYVVNFLETGYYERLPYFIFHVFMNFVIYSNIAALFLLIISLIGSLFRRK